MKLNSVFVDTSMFVALLEDKDEFHLSSVSILEKLKEEKVQLVTSNNILIESFTIIRGRKGRQIVDKFRKSLANEMEIKIVRIIVQDEASAWDWFLMDWGKLSFTDCTSFALMKRLKIERVASFDRDFERAGFIIEKS